MIYFKPSYCSWWIVDTYLYILQLRKHLSCAGTPRVCLLSFHILWYCRTLWSIVCAWSTFFHRNSRRPSDSHTKRISTCLHLATSCIRTYYIARGLSVPYAYTLVLRYWSGRRCFSNLACIRSDLYKGQGALFVVWLLLRSIMYHWLVALEPCRLPHLKWWKVY